MSARVLYHYTCAHAVVHIRETMTLRPWRQVALDSKPLLIWLTDLDVPDRAGLGLTSQTLKCDRMAYRVTADCSKDECVRWIDYSRAHCSKRDRHTLHGPPGVMPMHWWVTAGHLPVFAIDEVS